MVSLKDFSFNVNILIKYIYIPKSMFNFIFMVKSSNIFHHIFTFRNLIYYIVIIFKWYIKLENNEKWNERINKVKIK